MPIANGTYIGDSTCENPEIQIRHRLLEQRRVMVECQPDDAFGQLLEPEQQRDHREGYLSCPLRFLDGRYADSGK
ncbi:MAG TPA: hypothetical protein VFB28_08365 [Terriglobales bacterium]|nr:hypothetical protein [Terriglobales bacterium]